MEPINFVISMATMKHPNKWAIFELTFNKTFKYYLLFSNESSLDILAKTLNFLLALEQTFET